MKKNRYNSKEGEFVAVNVYKTTSIDIYRAIMKDNGELIVIDSSDSSPYQKFYSIDTGLISRIEFYIAGESIDLTVNTNGYAVGEELQEINLPEVGTIFIGHSSQRVVLTGSMTTLEHSTLRGLKIFTATECEMLD